MGEGNGEKNKERKGNGNGNEKGNEKGKGKKARGIRAFLLAVLFQSPFRLLTSRLLLRRRSRYRSRHINADLKKGLAVFAREHRLGKFLRRAITQLGCARRIARRARRSCPPPARSRRIAAPRRPARRRPSRPHGAATRDWRSRTDPRRCPRQT